MNSIATAAQDAAKSTLADHALHQEVGGSDALMKGNRKIITDFYVPNDIVDKKFPYTMFVRLNAKKIKFTQVSFQHCIFDGCYFNTCVFDSCDFTGCKFVAANLHLSAFTGCKFDYATFERTQISDDILLSEAPREENLRMRFARSLRMNFQQIGDAKAVNKAISLELEATSVYLYKSWCSKESYFKEKYPGFIKSGVQFLRWVEFWVLDFIWGNGESIVKLIRTIALSFVAIGIYDTLSNRDALNIGDYWNSFTSAPSVFLGVSSPSGFSASFLSIIGGGRLVSVALLTALLVKRFSRR